MNGAHHYDLGVTWRDGVRAVFARRRQDGEDLVKLDAPETRYIAAEVAGSHTGVYLGMYATGNGAPGVAPADFDWFDYRSM